MKLVLNAVQKWEKPWALKITKTSTHGKKNKALQVSQLKKKITYSSNYPRKKKRNVQFAAISVNCQKFIEVERAKIKFKEDNKKRNKNNENLKKNRRLKN